MKDAREKLSNLEKIFITVLQLFNNRNGLNKRKEPEGS